MKDLQSGPQAGRFQVELAEPPAAAQFIADEQGLAIEAAADRFELGVDGQGLQLRQAQPAGANAVGQGIHQGVDPQNLGWGWLLSWARAWSGGRQRWIWRRGALDPDNRIAFQPAECRS